MEDTRGKRVAAVYDAVWDLVIPYIHESRDRASVSLVCKLWYDIDASTRKHVTMPLSYTATPSRLSRRFPHLESLKLNGKPRATMFKGKLSIPEGPLDYVMPLNKSLTEEDWGGHAAPWVEEIARATPEGGHESLRQLKALHFRRMIVTDSDLNNLARSRGLLLQSLKIDKCSGFSTDGLLKICQSCKNLSTFVLEESKILQKDRGEWLHELAVNNSVLENLNFYKTDLWDFRPEDIELIARNCPRLVSMKVSQSDMSSHFGFFRAATALEEFAGGFVHVLGPIGENMQYADFAFPPRLCSLGLTYFRINEMPILFPICSRLRKLDLLYAEFDTQGHCTLLEKCVNLEILEATNVIGDRGLEVLSRFCKKLKRLRIERGGDEDELGMEDEDEQGMEDEEGSLTQRGLVALSQGCLELQYLAVYVSDITNQALRYIGKHLKHLSDFRLVLLDRGERITDFPLDKGVRSLLRGCPSLIRFALYLRSGGLTDKGLNYVGQYSPNVRWMFLGYVGESDEGLLQFSEGCPCLSLQKLEMRGCFFSERALAMASSRMTSLRYLWVEGFNSSSIGSIGQDLLRMARPFWNIGVIPARGGVMDVFGGIEPESIDHSSHMLAYYSLDGRRTDTPETVVCLDRNNMELGG